MPIKAENKARYPKDWKQISERIRFERAENKCEFCGVPNGLFIVRGETFEGKPCWQDDDGAIWSYPENIRLGDNYVGDLYGKVTYAKIVLTVAHLDHTPENCEDENLKALCQKCHNAYDRQHRNETRKANTKQIDLF